MKKRKKLESEEIELKELLDIFRNIDKHIESWINQDLGVLG